MTSLSDTTLTGTVFRVETNRYEVHADSITIPCTVRGRLKKEARRVTSLIVVGDRVSVAAQPDGTGVIEHIHPRRTLLARPGSASDRRDHAIAANVDLLVVVASTHQPPFRRHLVERYLMLAQHCGLKAAVAVNKCDLADPRLIASWTEPLRAAGVTVLPTSTQTGAGLGDLAALLRGQTAVFVGQSGVGKSSLTMALCPDLRLRTQTVNTHERGRHTTTASALYALPDGGYIVDTPGIKQLDLFAVEAHDLTEVFPEIEALADGCRYRDCTHDHEPECAVKDALASGALDAARYRSYLKLQRRS